MLEALGSIIPSIAEKGKRKQECVWGGGAGHNGSRDTRRDRKGTGVCVSNT